MAKQDIIVNDVKELTNWLEKRSQNTDANTLPAKVENPPALYKIICEGESSLKSLDEERASAYSKFFKHNKKRLTALTIPAATGIVGATSASTILGASASTSVASLLSPSLGVLGTSGAIGSAATGLGLISLSSLLLPVLGIGAGVLAFNKFTNFKFSLAEKNESTSRSLEKIIKLEESKKYKYQEMLKECQERANKLLNEDLPNALAIAKEKSDKLKISIDDALNVDQNLHIMQYQQIVLNQYNKQYELEMTLDQIITSYNNLQVEMQNLLTHCIESDNTNLIYISANEYLK